MKFSACMLSPSLFLSVNVELSCDSTPCPNELVLSYEAVRLPHNVNITKQRISATLRADEKEIETERGRTGRVCWGGGGFDEDVVD